MRASPQMQNLPVLPSSHQPECVRSICERNHGYWSSIAASLTSLVSRSPKWAFGLHRREHKECKVDENVDEKHVETERRQRLSSDQGEATWTRPSRPPNTRGVASSDVRAGKDSLTLPRWTREHDPTPTTRVPPCLLGMSAQPSPRRSPRASCHGRAVAWSSCP